MVDIRCQRRTESHHDILELGDDTSGPGDGTSHVVPGQELLRLVGDDAGVRRVVVDVPGEARRRDRDGGHAGCRDPVARVVRVRHAQYPGTKIR